MNGQKFLRGQVWWISTNKELMGNIQSKNRPHVILSNNIGNRNAPIVTVVPCTSEEKKDIPTHVKCEINGIQNTILCEQIRTVNSNELLRYMFTLDEKIMKELDDAIMVALGIKNEEVKIHKVDALRYEPFIGQERIKPKIGIKTIDELKQTYISEG